jgi:hypothetical protein
MQTSTRAIQHWVSHWAPTAAGVRRFFLGFPPSPPSSSQQSVPGPPRPGALLVFINISRYYQISDISNKSRLAFGDVSPGDTRYRYATRPPPGGKAAPAAVHMDLLRD